MKLLPCVLSALIVQQADAKRKKRGKQYLTVGQNPAAETEVCVFLNSVNCTGDSDVVDIVMLVTFLVMLMIFSMY